jgi:DNA mismatch repair protein MSH5
VEENQSTIAITLASAPEDLPRALRLASDYTFAFATPEGIYFKNGVARSLDESVGDVAGKIADLERHILVRLEQEVLARRAFLLTVNTALGDFECLFALFMAAQAYGLRRPLITEQSCLIIVDGRHLLSELVVAGMQGQQ